MSDRIFWGIRNTGIGLMVLSCLMAIALLMGGCSTYKGDIYIALASQEEAISTKTPPVQVKIEIQNKNIPVNTDASIPAGALGL